MSSMRGHESTLPCVGETWFYQFEQTYTMISPLLLLPTLTILYVLFHLFRCRLGEQFKGCGLTEAKVGEKTRTNQKHHEERPYKDNKQVH